MHSFDVIRGFALILVVFFHAAVYNFANPHKIDFSNPPLSIVIISFAMLGGGFLIVYSGIFNTLMTAKRVCSNEIALKYAVIAGTIYIVLHYIHNFVLGRWNIDFVANMPDRSLIAASLRNMQLTFPHFNKFFEGSTLGTIGCNLIIVSVVLHFLLKNNGIKKEYRNYLLLAVSATLIMLLSFIRIYMYSFRDYFVQHNYFLAFIYSFVIANPYPLLPYLSYGLIAALFGLMIYNGRKDLIKKLMIPLAAFFFIYGLIGCLNFPKTISKADYFWYFKTHLELGIFMLMVIFVLFFLEYRQINTDKLKFVKLFSIVSLTVYLLETTVSEIFAKILTFFLPSWNQTINNCLLFGTANVLFWIFILSIWEKKKFKHSLEYYWVKLFGKFGKESTKLQEYQ